MVDNEVVSTNDTLNISHGLVFDKLSPFPIDLSGESYEKFKDDQLSDSTLISCWSKAANGSKEFIINSDNGLFYHKHMIGATEVFQLILPENKRQLVIASSHDSNWSRHFESVKTLKRIEAYFYWPGIINDVRKFVTSCDKCQKRLRITKFDRVPINPVPYSMIPFKIVNYDLIGPIESKSSSGHRYILCLIDPS